MTTANMPQLDQLQVVVSDIATHRAVVSVSASRHDTLLQQWLDDGEIEASIRGPRCELSRTLPAGFTLRPAKLGDRSILRCVVTDPSFWSGDLPAIYDVTITRKAAGIAPSTTKRSLGVRPLGRSRGYLTREGKVWIPRLVACDTVPASSLVDSFREQVLGALIDLGGDATIAAQFLAAASQRGCYSVAHCCAASEAELLEQVVLARQFPAVMMACFPANITISERLRDAALGLMLAYRVDRSTDLAALDRGGISALVICGTSAGEITELAHAANFRGPILAQLADGQHTDLAAARAACDQLQRDLAALPNRYLPIAGLVV
ncbi:hypothetical protein Psta_2048 [Pirellula staleyi DSM 6068]|uniref:Uncharacterized protein n=1 Tax=Pirellula staleyi (strain ATCC 27377 / DSM 6068 / ICPB 4128) TaxID=530564 RepID=D2R1K3_PIRSD|nr:hypothetical protein [Pirellula staleyi]ADB16722.1 hypothetical protein Psta_2048 [Pirellula staleyi DSM 6068]